MDIPIPYTAYQVQVHYALKQKDSLTKNSLKSSFEEKYLIESGLSINFKNNMLDRFKQRIMFPIHSFTGRILGFGGRALNKNEKAKYLNSPETEVFEKGKHLFGLDKAANPIRKADKAQSKISS